MSPEGPAMTSRLARVLTDRILRQRAGPRAFDRGERYFADRRVRGLAELEGILVAVVRGRREYRVRLWTEGGDLRHACTCPVGTDNAFCKHGVAVGLTWLHAMKQGDRSPTEAMERVKAYLDTLDRETLVRMLVERAMEDQGLRKALLLRATLSEGGPDLDALRHVIDGAFETGGPVDFAEAWDYARGVSAVVDALRNLLEAAPPDDVKVLGEDALSALERNLGRVDDPRGLLGDLLGALLEIHHDACARARPEPEALARRLFDWQIQTEWDTFLDAAERYADVLGSAGLSAYQRLAAAEWERLVGFDPRERDRSMRLRMFQLVGMLESLVRATGDPGILPQVREAVEKELKRFP